jgi:hypothetical protein
MPPRQDQGSCAAHRVFEKGLIYSLSPQGDVQNTLLYEVVQKGGYDAWPPFAFIGQWLDHAILSNVMWMVSPTKMLSSGTLTKYCIRAVLITPAAMGVAEPESDQVAF